MGSGTSARSRQISDASGSREARCDHGAVAANAAVFVPLRRQARVPTLDRWLVR